jgi:macrolide transport system ATP-binding/permease protein
LAEDLAHRPVRPHRLDNLLRLLASIGLYGVISYTIARRTNEIGIRMALGDRGAGPLDGAARDPAAGARRNRPRTVLAVLVSARVLSNLLFGLSAYDPLTIAAATAVLVAIMAGVIPGSRATRVDPTEALR